jgi:cytochrome d ubiquinol oxidase subunit I
VTSTASTPRASAGENRRDRRPLGKQRQRSDAADPVRLAGHERRKTKFAVEIPYLGSLILTHSLDKQVPALKEFPPEDRPNSTIVFWSFRVMVGLGLMIFTGLWSLWLRKRDTLYTSRRSCIWRCGWGRPA